MPPPGGQAGVQIPESLPSAEPLDVDRHADEFERKEVIGRGGNATVYAASPPGDPDTLVAIKEPHVPDEGVGERFRSEAETWAAIDDHPHAVTVYDWATEPTPWIALEYMDGGSLRERTGDCDLAEGLWIGACVAAAVGHAHGAGVAHLDLKPGNVLFRAVPDDGWPVPKVADWGLAGALHSETVNLEGLSPRYAAPEQFAPARFGSPGPATDVYGLGVVLYELFVGSAPFGGPPKVLRDAVLYEPPPPPSGRDPESPTAVDDLLDRALAKQPADRYGSMAAFRGALEDLFVERTGYDPDGGVAGPAGVDLPTPAAGTDAGPSTAASPYERALTLADEGFVQLSEAYFARREPAAPLEAWRRGVTLADARAGRAVERTVPGEGESGRVALDDRLLDGLAGRTDHVVLGPVGSGKSTLCKRVACEWFDRGRGPVFYRESGQGERFDRPDALARRVTDAEGHALVVVEDAVRPEATAVFEFLDRVGSSDEVAVLLDARESEWRDAGRGADAFGTDPVTAGREGLEPVYVPRPDAHEHERFVSAVEAAADRSIDVDVERLQADVRRAAASDPGGDETRPGELFYLLHRLTTLARDPLEDADGTTLTAAVAEVYDRLADAGEDALDIGVYANALNAAGIGVHPELLYAAVPDDPVAVDDAIDVLEGRVVFPREADWSDGTAAYPTIHEAWSTEFLGHLLEVAGETAASERFVRVLTRVLSLADDPARREQVAGALRDEAPYLARVEREPERWADETVEALHALGRDRPKLAPLFGTGERDSIDLPEACSATVVEQRAIRLGRMFLDGGYFERAERAYERVPAADRGVERLLGLTRVAKERGELDDAVTYAERCLDLLGDDERATERARAQLHLGRALSNRGDFEAANTHLRSALERFESIGDDRRTATTLDSIGIAAAMQNAYDRAREHLERSLDVSRRLGDRRGVANALNNLGEVSRHQGEFDRAREYHERSLEVRRELGDRSGEASSLNNLGIVAVSQGEFDRAREYYERSLETARDIGYRQGEMNTISNLGNLLRRRGEYDRAREYQRQGLETARELGYRRVELATRSNLGEIARHQGQYDRAREHHERGLEIARESEFRYGEALNLAHLGEVARVQDRHERAREYLERGLEVAEEIGEPDALALNHHRLGKVATAQDEHAAARERFERALDVLDAAGNKFEATRIRLACALLALDRGDADLAGERARAAHETFAGLGASHWTGRSRRLLGLVAAEMGDHEEARGHWLAALEIFEAVGAPQDALRTLRNLVETGAADDDRVGDWCARAEEIVSSAPEPVADRHRAWLDRACGDR